MFFSVIVPVYNVAPYLRKCLDSLVHQTCKDKEIILVDDGSTDSSETICDEYAEQYPFVSVVHQENQGPSGARNTGIEKATGEWLSFVDSDDWVDTDIFERLQEYIIAMNADIYRFGNVYVKEDDDHNICMRKSSRKGTIMNIGDEETLFRCYLQNFGYFYSVWAGVYRHSIIREHHLRFVDTREIYFEDLLFNFQYVLHARKIVFLHDTPYKYRENRSDSITTITGGVEKLLYFVSFLEHAYQTTVEQGLTYFQQHFYKIYIKLLNFQVNKHTAGMDDAQVRQLLDKMSRSKLYRKCISQQLKEDGDTPTEERLWYRKSFGKKGRSALSWRLFLLSKRIKYAIKHAPQQPLEYAMCEEKNVAYAVNSKGACSSIIVSMLRRDDIRDDYSVFKPKVGQKILKKLLPIRDAGWFTFTFVRNPFARLVSCYESKYHEDKTKNSVSLHRNWHDFDYYLDGYIREDRGFEHFINQVMRIPYPMEDVHFCSQYHRFIGSDGQSLVNFIGKVENLEADYEPIRQKYGFDPLKHYNKVNYGDWRDYYTTKLAKKVYRKYKKDVKYFGYEDEYRDLLDYCKRKERKNMS